MGLILSLETGTDTCSVALARGGIVVDVVEDHNNRDHASKLGVFVDKILKSNNLTPGDLNAIAVSRGPGSYTGLRIGVSLAKGMCYALNIPLIAVGTLESLAHVAAMEYNQGRLCVPQWQQTMLCPMIDARRMEVYAQIFDSHLNALTTVDAHIISEDSFSDYTKSGALLVFGSGAAKCRSTLTGGSIHFADIGSSARGMAALAEHAFEQGRFEDIAYFEPLYLKDFVITQPKKRFF